MAIKFPINQYLFQLILCFT